MEVSKCINQIKKLGKAQSFTYVFVNMAVITAIVVAVIKCLSHGMPKTLFLVKNISVLFAPRQKMVNVKFLKNSALVV